MSRPALVDLLGAADAVGALAPPGEVLAAGQMDVGELHAVNDAWARLDPTAIEQFGAAFRRVSPTGIGLGLLARDRPEFEPDPAFNAAAAMRGADMDLPQHVRGRLMAATSREELDWLRAEYRRLQRVDDIMAHGPLHPIAAGLLAGLLDPINLIPLGWAAMPLRALRGAGNVARIGRALGEGAAIGGAAMLMVEPLLRADDPFRTYVDTLQDMLITGAFGATLVGGAEVLRVVRGRASAARVDAATMADALRLRASEEAAASIRLDPAEATERIARLFVSPEAQDMVETMRLRASPEAIAGIRLGAAEAADRTARLFSPPAVTGLRASPEAIASIRLDPAEAEARVSRLFAQPEGEGVAEALRLRAPPGALAALRLSPAEMEARASRLFSGMNAAQAEDVAAEAMRLRASPEAVASIRLEAAEAAARAARLFSTPAVDTMPAFRAVGAQVADWTQDRLALNALRTEGLRVVGERWLRPMVSALARLPMGIMQWPGLTMATSRFDASRRFMASFADTGIRTRMGDGSMTDADLERAFRAAEAAGYALGRDAFMAQAREAVRDGINLTDMAPLLTRIDMHTRALREASMVAFNRARADLVDDGFDVPEAVLQEAVVRQAEFMADPTAFAGLSPVDPRLVPRIEALIREVRDEILTPLIERARKSGMFDNIAEGAQPDPNYWPFALDRQAIMANEPAFRRALVDMLQAQRARAEAVVRPHEEAVEAWMDHGRRNAASLRAMRVAVRDLHMPGARELRRQYLDLRRAVGAARADKTRAERAARVFRDENDVAPIEQWVAEQERRNAEAAETWSEVYSQELERIAALRAAATTEQERAVAAAIDARTVAALEAENVTGFRPAEFKAAQDWIEANVRYSARLRELEAFAAVANADWRAFTLRGMTDLERGLWPGGLDVPSVRPRRPVPPPEYERHRRLIRSANPDEPARLETDAAVAREAGDIIQAALYGEDPYRFTQLGMRGHLVGRGLEVDWQLMAPFTHKEFSRIVENYITMTVRDIETFRTFNTLDVSQIMRPLADEAHAAQAEALARGDEADALRIAAESRRDMDLMKAMVAQARGVFIQPARTINEARLRSALNTSMNLSFMVHMGSGALAQIGDFTRATLVHGLTRYVGSYAQELGRGLARDETIQKFARQFGTMNEVALLDHQRLLYDVAPMEHQTAVGRLLQRAVPTFARFTLMPWMNDMMRRAAINIVQDDLYRLLTAGERTADMRLLMTQAALTPADIVDLQDIARTYAGVGPDGRMDFHVELWAGFNPDLAEKFRAAVHMATQRATIVPSAADAPLWTQTTIGRPIVQFKRFVYASVPQLLVPALQAPGWRQLEVALAAVMFGTLSTVLRDINATGEVRERSAGEWVIDSLDMSGLTSMLSEVDGSLGKINPHLSARYLLLGEHTARFAERTAVAQLLGPTAGMAITTIPRALQIGPALLASDLDVQARNIAAFRQLWPYQNHILLRHPLDVVEASAGGRPNSLVLDILDPERIEE